MPATGGRRGRRDNGLVASHYDPVGDVDPRVGEHLLDVLAGDGIAAYLQPSTDQHPITRTTTLPARPTDRLYVDSDHVATARDYLSQVTAVPAPLIPHRRRGRPQPATPTPPRRPTSTANPTSTRSAEIVAGYHLTAIPTSTPVARAPRSPWTSPASCRAPIWTPSRRPAPRPGAAPTRRPVAAGRAGHVRRPPARRRRRRGVHPAAGAAAAPHPAAARLGVGRDRRRPAPVRLAGPAPDRTAVALVLAFGLIVTGFAR